jgi:hypothetical protein
MDDPIWDATVFAKNRHRKLRTSLNMAVLAFVALLLKRLLNRLLHQPDHSVGRGLPPLGY